MRAFAFVALLALLAACTGGGDSLAPAGLGPAELRQVPTTSGRLAGFTYRLETYLWRDFMPTIGGSPNGSPLLAAITVAVDDDGAAFPASVTVDRAWVLNGDAVWVARPREEQPRGADGRPGQLHVMAREGPRWGPGIAVDVIVRLRDASGATLLLRAPAQPIHRTD